MPYLVTLNADEQLIEVVSTGNVSLTDIKGAIQRISNLREESGVTDVLSDATGQHSNAVTLDISGVKGGLPTGLRVAVIVDQGQQTESDMDLMARLVRSRGSVCQTFSSREKALQWLKAT